MSHFLIMIHRREYQLLQHMTSIEIHACGIIIFRILSGKMLYKNIYSVSGMAIKEKEKLQHQF